MKKNYLIFIFFLTANSIFAQYIGEIRMFAGDFAPNGWAICDGQTIQIAENETLFQIIGKTYGGDGITNFKIPDLRGRVPVGVNSDKPLGMFYGEETITLIPDNLPPHSHQLNVSVSNNTAKTNAATANSSLSVSGFNSGNTTVSNASYTSSTANLIENSATVSIKNTGQTNPISIVKPSLSINYIIALYGIYP